LRIVDADRTGRRVRAILGSRRRRLAAARGHDSPHRLSLRLSAYEQQQAANATNRASYRFRYHHPSITPEPPLRPPRRPAAWGFPRVQRLVGHARHSRAGIGSKLMHHPTLGPVRYDYASFQANDDAALKLALYTRR
jgi:hypothetical protein